MQNNKNLLYMLTVTTLINLGNPTVSRFKCITLAQHAQCKSVQTSQPVDARQHNCTPMHTPVDSKRVLMRRSN